jgi:hypothetical protein
VRKVRGTAPPQREAPQEPVIRAAAHPLHEQLADTTKQFIQYEKDRRKKDWLTRQTMKRRNEFTPVQSVAQNAPLALRTTRGYPEARKSARPPIRSEGLNKETSRRSVRLVFSFEPITRGNNVSASCCNRSTTVLKHQHHFTTVRVDEGRFFGAYAVPIIRARPPISAVSSVIRARSAALMSGTRFAKRRTYPVLAAICPFSSPDVFQRIVITLSLGLGAC